MGISSEELNSALRRAVASRSQQQQQQPSPTGGSATPPSTAAKPPKTVRCVDRGESPAATRSGVSTTPKAAESATQSSDNGTIGASTAAGATPPRRIGENPKNGTTEKDGASTSVKREGSGKLDSAAASTDHRPVTQTHSASATSDAAAVASSAIAGAVSKLKARPQTMAPVSGPTSSEPAWMTELAARKKQRDHNETTNL
jgi:hypothetical protein